ncbi:MAG: hypothetical protein ACLP7I_14220 [Limisphaerales bacterium]
MAIDDLRFEVIQRGRHDACVKRFSLANILLWLCVITTNADDVRIWWGDTKIDGKSVHLNLDTASDTPITLYSNTAQKLGLKVLPDTQHSKSNTVSWGTTTPYDFDSGPVKIKVCISVLLEPSDPGWPEDGVIGWPFVRQFFSNYSLLLDLATNRLGFLTNSSIEFDAWNKLSLQTNLGVLAFCESQRKGNNSVIVVDTGTPYGVKLSPLEFRKWKANHTNNATTVVAYETLQGGRKVIAKQEIWADKISVGPIVLTGVPVTEASVYDVASGTSSNSQFMAMLGVAALKRVELIIDNQQNVARFQPVQSPPALYQHNRLGAVFIPSNSNSTNLIACVANDSPAYNAGIRDGDILLNREVNGNFELLPGTKLKLTLKRGDKIFTTTAVLRNILPPDKPKNSN